VSTLLLTGGAGFIGSNLIRFLLRTTDVRIVNLDALTYAGNLENLSDVERDPRLTFVRGSITDAALVDRIITAHSVDGIINCAAESHVDRSIASAAPFVDTNVTGTLVLLEAAKKHGLQRFLQMSTDEVYGSLGPVGAFSEDTPIAPNSPYSASKASADLLVRAFVHTHNVPAVITRCSNNYGPFQFPEKFLPVMILNAMEERPLPLYGNGLQVRDWIHVDDHCAAVWLVYTKGRVGEVYNIGAENERPNLHVAREILRELGKTEALLTYVTDRPGHDVRYAINASKIRTELGWRPTRSFDEGLRSTVAWYREHQAWCENIRSGAYNDYYERHYTSGT
jgi:dTDP-glucose 4,6-dehydratase